MAADDGFEKSLPPSERKLEKAREDGQGLKLADLSFLSTTILTLGFYFFFWKYIVQNSKFLLTPLNFWTLENGLNPIYAASVLWFLCIAISPLMLAAVFSSLLNWLWGGRILSMKAITPDISRIDPISRAGQLFQFGLSTIGWPFLKGMVMMGLTIFCSFLIAIDFSTGKVQSVYDVLYVIGYLIFLFCVFAFFDAGVQIWKRTTEMMMSMQELKDEMKESEGNPQIKGRQRAIARERSRARMMSALNKANVVVVNPEHYLIALRWDRDKDAAPVIVAKATDALAQNMKARAKVIGLPVLEIPPLARSLWRVGKLDRPIPETHFKAMAIIFAWIASVEGRSQGKMELPSTEILMDGIGE